MALYHFHVTQIKRSEGRTAVASAAYRAGEKLHNLWDGETNEDVYKRQIKDFYENEELIAITKELAETLRKNKTIDWQRKETARAKMRTLIKRLLKKHKYPPEGMDDAVQTVMTQCELWTDNNDMSSNVVSIQEHRHFVYEQQVTYSMVAEESVPYGKKE